MSQQARCIPKLIEAQARRSPSSIALLAPGRPPITYQGLFEQVARTAQLLKSVGIGRSDRVALVVSNGPEMATAFLATAAMATCAPLNPGYKTPEFDFYFSDLQPKALIVESGLDSAAADAARARNIPVIELRTRPELPAGLFTLEGGQPGSSGQPEFACPSDVALVLHTSGTTSRPKIVPLTHANLCRSAWNIADSLNLAADDRCLNVMPLFHVHGLIGAVLSSLAAGASIVCAPGFLAPRFFDWLDEFQPTWYTAVPTIHQAILARVNQKSDSVARSRLRFVRSCSSALPVPVFEQLEQRLGVPVIEAYGMTEGAHQIASNPLPPGRRKPGSVGIAAGPEIAIMDDGGNLLPPGYTGEIVIRGENVTAGYDHNPAANESAFRSGWFRTGDQGRMDEDGYVFITGRLKELINRGGEKISPREIDDILLSHPAVAQALAFAVPHEKLGEEVAAVVVLRPGTSAGEAELQEFAAARLAEFKVPRRILLVYEIPKGATGKPQRIGLAAKLLPAFSAPAPLSEPSGAPPRTPAEALLCRLFREVLGLASVGIHDDFFRLGGDSILAVQLLLRARAAGVEIPRAAIFANATPAALAERAAKSAVQAVPIPHSRREGPLPLSFAQQRMWFLAQYEEDPAVYIQPWVLRLEGPLDITALEASLTDIVVRHEPLRTRYENRDGSPVQIVSEPRPLQTGFIDMSGASLDAALRVAAEEARKPFDLARDLLLRATVVRLGPDDHLLLLATHHIASDGWSRRILFRELSSLYTARTERRAAELPELQIQYADFACWEAGQFSEGAFKRQIEYWKERLSGSPEILSVPADRPRPARRTGRGAREMMPLPRPLTDAFKSVCRQEGVTLFMALLGAFQALIHRYTGEANIVTGSPSANRTRAEVEPLIGLFVNTLPLRTDFSCDPQFRELLARVRETAMGAYAHEEVPFEQIVAAVRPDRSISRMPLFQVTFQLRNRPDELHFGGLRAQEVDLDPGTAQFDLSFEVREKADGFDCLAVYSTDLFDAATIRRLLGHYQTLLESAVKNADARVSDLPILTAEEHRQLAAWNDTRKEYPRLWLHQFVEKHAQLTPDAEAVVFERQRLTYRELNRRANRLAGRLRDLGVGPEVLVGLCAERSLELVVAMLAILKAGGAYVPLDPAYPKERLAFMLEDAKPRVVLVQPAAFSALPPFDGAVVSLEPESACTDADDRNPDVPVSGETLAYVLFTSGSTGRPKGAMNTHAAISNRIHWMQDDFPLTPADSVLQKAPFTFDVSIWEFFWPLMAGARLVLARPGGQKDSAYLAKLIQGEQITTMGFVPSMLRAFLEEPEVGRCDSVKRVFSGGEALSWELTERFHARSNAELVNVYGPTEAAVDVTFWRCERGGSRRTVPIGRPIANARIYIVDQRGNPVPVGVPGELCIGGLPVGRGYVNRPELTAEKFIADPFDPDEGARLYRTGDLARYLPDGTIEYLGRLDDQVKVRGVRIELGEVAAALRSHPGVADAAAAVHEDAVTGYVVGRAAQTLTAAELKAFLGRMLPEAMIPSHIVFLGRLPLTSNGKLDRRALPAPNQSRPADAEFIAPRTELEAVLGGIWAEVLKLDAVGVRDDFFELGGHSLLATRVVSRMRDGLGFDVTLRDIFEHPTIEGLAAVALGRGQREPARATVGQPKTGPRPLSFAQERLWYTHQFHPDSPAYNIPTVARLSGPIDCEALQKALNALADRHETLRTTISNRDGGPVQIIAPEGRIGLDIVDIEEQRAEQAIGEEIRRPFDLERGPLVRACLLRLAPAEHVLLLTVHHIISDGWSSGILFRELGHLYSAFLRGAAPSLPPLPTRYAEFGERQRDYFRGDVLDRQLAYWKDQLAGLPAVLELPSDHPRPPRRTDHGGCERLVFPPGVAAQINEFSRREGVTVFMTLLAAFQTLLHRTTGQTDICIGAGVAGRTRVETENLVGFFVNTLPLRTDLSGDPTFRELLGRVKTGALGAYAHQELPFDMLVQALRPERSLSYDPLVQVMFVLHNAPAGTLEFPGVDVRPLEVHNGTAKFDLTLSVEEAGEGLSVGFEYSADLFEPPTVRRLLGYLRMLLEAAVRDPGERVSRLQIMPPEERRRLLLEWNDTRGDYPQCCVHELFEQQAARRPDALAIVCGDERLTYGELNRRANGLAARLRALGVQAETLVGLCGERSPDMIAGMLAILKAGGAYLPLDPQYPPERLAFMLRDAGARVLVTQRRFANLPSAVEIPVVCLEEALAENAGPCAPAAGNRPGLDNLAYVMYTSGSTGVPKGVEIPHRGIVRLLFGVDYARFGEDEVLLQAATLSFDASTFEVWGALLHGGRCVLLPEAVPSARDLRRVIARHRVTTAFLTSALFNAVVDEDAGALAPLRQLLTGGEVASVVHMRRALEMLPETGIIHCYGPTECTTFASCYAVPRTLNRGSRSVPIGRPIGNTQAFVLDAQLEPVPVGAPGELYLGGDGLARGYHNRPELTAERFIVNPFGTGRLYKTGDLVRYRSDRNIEFLGRLDDQVKIRGFRIELGEVEAQLAGHPAVKAAAAVVREPGPGDRRLIAYVVRAQACTSAELRDYLKHRLPDYMVPSGVCFVDALPLNANGKVDRRKLAACEPEVEAPAGVVGPRNEIEERVAQIWAAVLGRPVASTGQNFFDAGGHSLLATRVVSRVNSAFHVEVSVARFFEAPTIAGLADAIAQQLAKLLDEIETLSDEEASVLAKGETPA